MCPHVHQVTWSTSRYRSGARNGSVTHVDWHFVSLTAVGQEARRRKRCHQTGPRKEARAPKEEAVPEAHAGHAENSTTKESPHAWAGKGNYPFTTVWSSWRPGTFLGPSAAPRGFQNPRARPKQRRKRIFQRPGKRTLERDANCFFGCLWSNCKTRGAMPDMDLHSLLPVCALSPPTRESSAHDQPSTREGAAVRGPNNLWCEDQPIHRIQVRSVG